MVYNLLWLPWCLVITISAMIKFTVHMIIKNEDLWVWYALQSVLPYAEQILVYDTGSTDHTIEIIESIKSPKIIFEKKGTVTKKELVDLRQQQIDKTKTEWFLLVDGDEIWSEDQLKKLLGATEKVKDTKKAFFQRTRNAIGDVWHYLPESAGQYVIAGRKGNLNLRMIKKTKELKVIGEYPLEAYVDAGGPLIEQTESLEFVDCWYLHTSFLKRSTQQGKVSGSLGKSKKPEGGIKMDSATLPKVLFESHPSFLPDPLEKRDIFFELKALVLTPFLFMKRGVK